MNINFVVNKENEKVIVSNEKGIMETREYQDNIKDVLVLEDVVEKQIFDLAIKKENKKVLEQKTNDITGETLRLKKSWRKSIKYFLGAMFIFPLFCSFARVASEWITITGPIHFEMQMLKDGLVIGFGWDAIMLIIGGFWMLSPDCSLWNIRRLKKDKIDIEQLTNDLEIEISHLEEVLTKNKEELKQLEKQKEKNNIQNMTIEVQEVPYKEALEIQKTVLTQMKHQKSCEEKQTQEPTKPKGMILSRFKKKNN